MGDSPTVAQACQVCGQQNPATIEEHHVVPRRHGGSDHPSNLVSLCGSCHNAIESIYDDGFYQRLQQTGVPVKIQENNEDSGHIIESGRYSLDRQLPQSSPHYQGQLIPLSLDEPARATNAVEDWEKLSPEDMPENVWENPRPIKEERREKMPPLPDFVKEICEDESGFGKVVVIHCGYCNKLYGSHQQSMLASHLQIKHHIDDPYEPHTENIGYVIDEKRRVADEKIPNDPRVSIKAMENKNGFPKKDRNVGNISTRLHERDGEMLGSDSGGTEPIPEEFKDE